MKNFVKLKPNYKADDRNIPIYSPGDKKRVELDLTSPSRLLAYATRLQHRYGIVNAKASSAVSRICTYFAEMKQKTTPKYIRMIELGSGDIVKGYHIYMATEANGHDLKGVKNETDTNSTE